MEAAVKISLQGAAASCACGRCMPAPCLLNNTKLLLAARPILCTFSCITLRLHVFVCTCCLYLCVFVPVGRACPLAGPVVSSSVKCLYTCVGARATYMNSAFLAQFLSIYLSQSAIRLICLYSCLCLSVYQNWPMSNRYLHPYPQTAITQTSMMHLRMQFQSLVLTRITSRGLEQMPRLR